MSFVLAIEPDNTQANILRKILKGRIDADVLVVSTKDAAVEATSGRVPDLVLVSALLPPRDEDGLFAHLRTLEHASHLQTLTIPQLRRRPKPMAQGAFSVFRKKTVATTQTGCDPNLFLQEVQSYLARAQDMLLHPPAVPKAGTAIPPVAPVETEPSVPLTPFVDEAAAPIDTYTPVDTYAPIESYAPLESYEAPIETYSAPIETYSVPVDAPWEAPVDAFTEPTEAFQEPVEAAPEATEPATEPSKEAESNFAKPYAAEPYIEHIEPYVEEAKPAYLAAPTADEGWVNLELDRLIQQVGMESTRVEVRERDAELAQAEAEAQARMAAEIERVQRESEAHRQEELARLQAEAEAERTLAVNQARAEAEEQARSALAVELTRVRNEAEQVLANAEQARLNEIARVQAEADQRIDAAARQAREAAEAEATQAREVAEAQAAQAMMAELARMRAEVEETLNGQLERARAETDEIRAAELARAQAEATAIRTAAAENARIAAEAAASRALEAEVIRVRAEAETRLRAELEAVRQEAAHMRLAEQSEARQSAEKVREAALRDTRAIAEAANHTLESELRRVRAEADERLEAELIKARAQVEQQRAAELEEIRAQVAEMREAAALHARTSAAEAIAAEVARVAAESRAAAKPLTVVKLQTDKAAPKRTAGAAPAPAPPRKIEVPSEASATGQDGGDYYSLWQKENAPAPEAVVETPPPPTDEAWHFLAAVKNVRAKWAALPVAGALLLIGLSMGRGWKTDTVAAEPAPPAAAPAAPVNAGAKLGGIQIEATPAGARVILDGADAGKAPITLSGIKPGKHTVVLQSSAGTLTRKVTVRAGETAHVTESIFSGWLAVFSGVPLTISINGTTRGTTEDGQLTLAPGTYNVDLSSERFSYHETKSIKIEPGQIVSYSVKLPVTPLRLDAPEGMEISVDGQSAGVTPLPDLTVPIGTHEISGRFEGNERRRSIEAKAGEPAEVSLR